MSEVKRSMVRCSVLMPVYNSERFVSDAIESIRNQSFRDIELIVIDDGSTDGSADRMREHAAEDPRIRMHSRPNRGVVATRNELIGMASAPLIAWMDSDDIAYPERLALQVEAMEARPDLVAVGGQTRYIDTSGRPIAVHPLPLNHEEIDRVHMSGFGHAMAQPSVMIRRAAMISIGPMSPDYVAEDIDAWLKLAEIGRLANLNTTLIDYRLHPQSYGHMNRRKQAESAWQASVAAASRRGVPDPPRPSAADKEDRSVADLYRKWGWWALKSGYPGTAQYYAIQSLLRSPCSTRNWKLLACSLRGR